MDGRGWTTSKKEWTDSTPVLPVPPHTRRYHSGTQSRACSQCAATTTTATTTGTRGMERELESRGKVVARGYECEPRRWSACLCALATVDIQCNPDDCERVYTHQCTSLMQLHAWACLPDIHASVVVVVVVEYTLVFAAESIWMHARGCILATARLHAGLDSSCMQLKWTFCRLFATRWKMDPGGAPFVVLLGPSLVGGVRLFFACLLRERKREYSGKLMHCQRQRRKRVVTWFWRANLAPFAQNRASCVEIYFQSDVLFWKMCDWFFFEF